MRATFAPEARADLESIKAFLEPLNPQAAKRVVEAIKSAVRLVCENPRIGRKTPVEGIFEFIEPHYRYRLPYILKDKAVVILRVYHSRRAPLRYEEMKKP
jgi:plasmid stabilization system protein ParE